MTKKTEENKKLFLEQLTKTPVTQIACDKVGITRMTFHRWKKDDKEFSKKVSNALSEGNGLITDLAISQLISAIKERNLGAIKFWLENHSVEYAKKLHVTADVEHEEFKLSPELEALVRRALELVSLTNDTDTDYGI